MHTPHPLSLAAILSGFAGKSANHWALRALKVWPLRNFRSLNPDIEEA